MTEKQAKTCQQSPQVIDPQKESQLLSPSMCPLCQQENACNGKDINNCWCNDPSISFPPSILEQVPESSKGLACICKACAIKHQMHLK